MPETTPLAAVPTWVVTGGDAASRLAEMRARASALIDGVGMGEDAPVAVLLAAGRLGSVLTGPGLAVAIAPGGCACCAARLPFQVGLNRLLRVARPRALLIELAPGAHVEATLALLRGEDYRAVLAVRPVLEVAAG
jgi:hypothetical protein